ncbi:MAG: hypothetical protein IJC43_08710 [Clostridia bacterium]|nr:hypothetical protein [Clostridia bacterium]
MTNRKKLLRAALLTLLLLLALTPFVPWKVERYRTTDFFELSWAGDATKIAWQEDCWQPAGPLEGPLLTLFTNLSPRGSFTGNMYGKPEELYMVYYAYRLTTWTGRQALLFLYDHQFGGFLIAEQYGRAAMTWIGEAGWEGFQTLPLVTMTFAGAFI